MDTNQKKLGSCNLGGVWHVFLVGKDVLHCQQLALPLMLIEQVHMKPKHETKTYVIISNYETKHNKKNMNKNNIKYIQISSWVCSKHRAPKTFKTSTNSHLSPYGSSFHRQWTPKKHWKSSKGGPCHTRKRSKPQKTFTNHLNPLRIVWPHDKPLHN